MIPFASFWYSFHLLKPNFACRFRKHVEKTFPTHANKPTVHDSDDNLASESCSSAADDKACSSDELNLRSLHEESQKR